MVESALYAKIFYNMLLDESGSPKRLQIRNKEENEFHTFLKTLSGHLIHSDCVLLSQLLVFTGVKVSSCVKSCSLHDNEYAKHVWLRSGCHGDCCGNCLECLSSRSIHLLLEILYVNG